MITERTLRKWRTDALKVKAELVKNSDRQDSLWKDYMTVNDRILRMTQDLLDIHLLRKRRS